MKQKSGSKTKTAKTVRKAEGKTRAVRKAEEPSPSQEHLEILVSDEYELTRPIPIRAYRYEDGTVVVRCDDLNLYAQGYSDHDARREFSRILVDELEDLESDVREGRALGRAMQIQLSLLRRLLRRIEG